MNMRNMIGGVLFIFGGLMFTVVIALAADVIHDKAAHVQEDGDRTICEQGAVQCETNPVLSIVSADLEADLACYEPGEEFAVTVQLDGLENCPVYGVQVWITWDTNVVTFVGCDGSGDCFPCVVCGCEQQSDACDFGEGVFTLLAMHPRDMCPAPAACTEDSPCWETVLRFRVVRKPVIETPMKTAVTSSIQIDPARDPQGGDWPYNRIAACTDPPQPVCFDVRQHKFCVASAGGLPDLLELVGQ